MTGEFYDQAKKKRILKEFSRVVEAGFRVVAAREGEEFARAIEVETRNECEALIPQIPDIEGSKNPYSKLLENSVVGLSLYKVLKRHGKSVKEIGELTYLIYDEYLKSMPKISRRLAGWWKLGGFSKRSKKTSRMVATPLPPVRLDGKVCRR